MARAGLLLALIRPALSVSSATCAASKPSCYSECTGETSMKDNSLLSSGLCRGYSVVPDVQGGDSKLLPSSLEWHTPPTLLWQSAKCPLSYLVTFPHDFILQSSMARWSTQCVMEESRLPAHNAISAKALTVDCCLRLSYETSPRRAWISDVLVAWNLRDQPRFY